MENEECFTIAERGRSRKRKCNKNEWTRETKKRDRMRSESLLVTVIQFVVSLADVLLEASELAPHPPVLQLDPPHDQYWLDALHEQGLEPSTDLADPLQLASFLIKAITKVKVLFAGLVLFVVVGGVFTAALCTLTSYCTLKLPELNFSKSRARYDHLAALTALFTRASDKYHALQKPSSNHKPQQSLQHSTFT